jgi:hypothetical protein
MAEETIAEEQEQEQEETNVDEVKDQRLEEESQRQIMQFMADHGGSEEEVETPEEETSQEEDETVEAETEEVAVLTNSMWDEAQEIALETASQYAQNTGKLLGDDQLLGLVENYYSQEAEKLLQHPKFSNRKASAVAEEKPTSRPVQRSRNRTLSQKTSRSSSSKKSDTPLTQDEILERAMGAFNGSLRV